MKGDRQSSARRRRLTDTPAGRRDGDRGKVSWGVFMLVVVGVLCIGVAAGFGVSERLQQRELLWRWLLDRSERTADDVAYRFEGHVWVVKDTAASILSVFRATRSISLAVVTQDR